MNRMLPGRDGNGAEGVIGPPDGHRLAINGGLPAGVVGVGQDQVAGLVGFDGEGDGVEVVVKKGEGGGRVEVGRLEGWKIAGSLPG